MGDARLGENGKEGEIRLLGERLERVKEDKNYGSRSPRFVTKAGRLRIKEAIGFRTKGNVSR